MKSRLIWPLMAAVLLLTASGAFAEAKVKTLVGTFQGVEVGDYHHLQVRDAKGRERSFFILNGDKSFQPFMDNPQGYRGRRIRVKWRTVEQNIPEAGGPMEIDEALSIQLIS